MSFKSYAQNFEDVILSRAFTHIAKGFYIDVGAYDPKEDSISLAFYERGWRGLHVEPVPNLAAKIASARPDEKVINAAISSKSNDVVLYFFEETGLTTGVPTFALQHALTGRTPKEITVPTRTLESIFDESGVVDIHWLKIDVEGMEHDVLDSWCDSSMRPWVLVIESTLPNSSTENYHSWECEVTKRGYSFAYFDGLNRFYVHEDHSELLKAFGPGPNYFDGFSLTERSVFVHEAAAQWRAETERVLAERDETISELRVKLKIETAQRDEKIKALSAQHDEKIKALSAAREHIMELSNELRGLRAAVAVHSRAAENVRGERDRLLASTSWRLTAPLRWAKLSVTSGAKSVARAVLGAALWTVRKYPAIKPLVLDAMSVSPPIKRRLIAFGQARPILSRAWSTPPSPPALTVLRALGLPSSQVSFAKFSERDYPLLSICITTYNRAPWLKHSLETLFHRIKGFEGKVELLVCDNASTDETPTVAALYLDRPSFRYVRNETNVGMLGNLGVTARHARGKFVWIIGDDDILLDGAIASILEAIDKHPDVEFIYTNYAYTHLTIDAFADHDELLSKQAQIAPTTEGRYTSRLLDVAGATENFFTAIYCCIFRADHAKAAYSQNTKGNPFTTLLTCVPTTQYVLDSLLERPAFWIGTPAILVNMNVSWLRYADLWVLERFPEMYQRFQAAGVPAEVVDSYRLRSIPGVVHHLTESINSKSANWQWISLRQLFATYKHLPEFRRRIPEIRAIVASWEDSAAKVDFGVLDDPYPSPIVVQGPFVGSYSLAIVNRNIAAALAGWGGTVALGPSPTEGEAFSIHETQVDPQSWMLFQASRSIDLSSAVNLRYTYPVTTDGMTGQLNVYHSFGWEESAFDLADIAKLNALDGVTVMSRFVRKVLLDHGLEVPIAVAGIGVDHIGDGLSSRTRTPGAKFTFLHVSSCFPRKGVDALLRAFMSKFNADDEVVLLIKTHPNPHNDVEQQVTDLRQEFPGAPAVQIINEDWEDQAKIVELYGRADVLVAPSRGEGFGLPLAEALLAGIPVIATGYGGHMDILDEEYPWLIDFDFEYAGTHFGLTDSCWANPRLDDLARLMRVAFESTPTERDALAQAYRRRILSRMGWADVAKRTASFLEDLSQFSRRQEAASILAGVITTWNTKCGIADYTRNLLSSFKFEEFKVLAPIVAPQDLLSPDDQNVERVWRPQQVSGAVDAIASDDSFQTVIIQHQPSFMNVGDLCAIVDAAIMRNKHVIIYFHNVRNFCDHITDEYLRTLCDGRVSLYVHSVIDLNLIKQRSPRLLQNATLFPMGTVPAVERKRARTDEEFRVSTFGFLLPHKGVSELIRGFAMVHRDAPHCRLHLYTSVLDERSRGYADECRRLIAKLGLDEAVVFNTGFLREKELLKNLAATDLIVLPYRSTSESGSAAVKMCLSSGTPLLVSPLPIFSDVITAVDFLKSSAPEDIATGIRERIAEPQMLERSREVQARWVAQHEWPRLSNRLRSIVRRLSIR